MLNEQGFFNQEITDISIESKNYLVFVNESLYFRLVKRLVDIVGSFCGLIVISPILLIIFILMKIEDPSAPFLFNQMRIGKNGKEFKMYKIRSMCVDAESKLSELLQYNEIEGAMFKMKEDPRVTKVGKFIRKTSLDEFPQLWNVLKGDMSLVGPRPPLGREVVDYSEIDKQRLLVKPGCTGLWQVSGRNDLDFKEMVILDLEYIKNQSIKLDTKIILRTIKIILIPNSAF